MNDSQSQPKAPWREWLLVGAIPGALGGTLLAGLLFHLNPELPFGFGSVVRATLLLGSVGAVVSVLLHIPLSSATWLRPRSLLPWTVTLVLGAGALLSWTHASRLSFYLPPGIGIRLTRVALGLSLAALIAFYTALLHSQKRRRYSTRSRLLMLALALLPVIQMIERRAAYRPISAVASRSPQPQMIDSPRLLVVGIDAASLEAILPLTEQGQLTFLANLMQQGVYGRLQTIDPIDPMPVWYSLATGQYPWKHGLVSTEVRRAPFVSSNSTMSLPPSGVGLALWGPLLGIGRATPPEPPSLAIWELLSRWGARTAIIGWPAPDASLESSEIAVSESFLTTLNAGSADGPPDFLREVANSRVGIDDIDPALYASFGDDLPDEVKSALAGDIWREGIARRLLADSKTHVFVHLPGLAVVSQRYFGGYMAVQFEGRQGPEMEAASNIVKAYYVQIDELLGRLWAELPSPRLMVVVSAWGADRAGPLSRLSSFLGARGRAVAGRRDNAPDGVFMLLGESLSSGTILDRAEVIDVTPTLLYGLGLPVAHDLDGTILTKSFGGGFLNQTPLTFVPTFSKRRDLP